MMDRLAILFPHHPYYHGLVDMPCTARFLVNEVLYQGKCEGGDQDKVKVFFVDCENAEAKNLEEILRKY